MLRLPTINQLWQSFAKRADRRGLDRRPLPRRTRRARARRAWQRRASAISGKPACCLGKSLASSPRTGRCRADDLRPRSARWPPATHGLAQGANCLISPPARPAPGKAISPRPSASPWSRTDTACSSPEPPIWSSACRWRAANSPRKPVRKLDRYHLLILDDPPCAEGSRPKPACSSSCSGVYERRSLLITANRPSVSGTRCSPTQQPVSWPSVDRLVHHATIPREGTSRAYRRRAALENTKRKRGRPQPSPPGHGRKHRPRTEPVVGDATRGPRGSPSRAASRPAD